MTRRRIDSSGASDSNHRSDDEHRCPSLTDDIFSPLRSVLRDSDIVIPSFATPTPLESDPRSKSTRCRASSSGSVLSGLEPDIMVSRSHPSSSSPSHSPSPSLSPSSVFRMCLVVVMLLSLSFTSSVDAFNLDTENCVRHRGPSRSMFGFSVAEHKEQGYSWVLVGAPEAQTNQPGVTRGGAVFRCDVNADDSCQEIEFDRLGNNNNSKGAQIDKKSHQWFGATVRSSGENGVVVACAPRYVWFSTTVNRRDPVGTCYISKNEFSDFSEYSPCRTRSWGYHRQGSCQAGLGASISKDGKRLFVGAVGSWYWQGQLYSIDSTVRQPFLPSRPQFIEYEPGQVFSQNLLNRQDVLSTSEGPPADDDSYLGYSVAVGDFSDDGEPGVAVGMPRGSGLLGKIILYNWNLTNLQNITGEQLGAYFGYSLCVVDVDGDELDDLIIGAPLYTDLTNNEGHYENGRVYVVYQGRETYKFRDLHTRDGKNSKSRFGLALTSLGDINKDGFGDFAVGAPYDGPNERGAVYIYHGSRSGVREKASQIIFAENVLPGLATTFGFSLSGGLDLDDNQYPDLIIGAYEADTAFFLRARPVVKMTSSLQFVSDSKQIALEDHNCTLRDGSKVPCLSLSTCLEYSGIGVDKNLDFDVQLLLDSKKPKSPRMFFLSEEGKNVMNQSLRLEKGTKFCKSMSVYIKSSVRDKLTPLEAEMRYTLREAYTHFASSSRRSSRILTPVLDMDDEFALVRRDSVSIQKNCGRDNVCIPDLRLIAQPSVKRYLLGSGERLYVDVLVQNEGEDSFESTFDMVIPTGMNYVNIERIDDAEKEIPVLCSAPSYVNNFTLHCDIGNPLPKEKLVHFKVILEPFHKEGMKPRYEFFMAVNSTNPEKNISISDNLEHLSVPIWVESDLILQGSSHPSDVHYNSTIYNLENITTEADIGPQVIHIYSIRNKGPSDILEAEALFLWPSYTRDGDHLLYLLEQPETSGPVKCELVEKVNEEEVVLDKKRKSYLELTGIQSSLMSSAAAQHSVSKGNNLQYEESLHKSSTASTSSTSSGTFNSRNQSNRQNKNEKNEKNEKNKHKKYSSEERRKFEESSYENSESTGGRFNSQSNLGGGAGRVETTHSSSRHNTERVNQNVRVPVETSVATSNRLSGSSSSKSSSESQLNVETNEGGHQIQESFSHVNFNPPPVHENAAASGSYVNRSSSTNYESSYGSGRTANAADSRRITSGGQRVESNFNRGSSADLGANRDLDFSVTTGGKDHSTFHSEEKNYQANTTWDSNSGPPRTVEHANWKTNDDGLIKNGSRSRVYTGHPNVDFGVESNYGSVTRSGSGNYDLDIDLANSQAKSQGQHYASSNTGNHYFAGDNVDSRSRSQQGYAVSEASEHSASESSRRFSTNGDDIWSNNQKGREKLDEERRNRANQAAKRKQQELERQEMERRRQEEETRRQEEETRRQEEERRVSEQTERRRFEEMERQRQEERRRSEAYERRRVEEERRVQEMQRQRSSHSSSASSSSSYQSSYQSSSKENRETEDGSGRLKLYTKYKREITLKDDEELADALNCGPTKCLKIKCTIGRLSKDQEGWVAFRSRVWMPTIKKIADDKEVHLSSMLAARVTKLPHIGVPDVPLVRSHEIRTQVLSRDSGIQPEMIPLWVVILSAVLGALILMLLIYCLYKCGFFKRNRPTNIPEKQPLNRNGIYQSGDEAL